MLFSFNKKQVIVGVVKMDTYTLIFDILIFITGIYMVYWSFSRTGPLYKTEYIKTNFEEKYKKLIKWFCLFGGIFACAAGALDYFKIQPFATIAFYVLCVIVAAVFVITLGFTDRKKVKNHK